jgi:hypothetical protein
LKKGEKVERSNEYRKCGITEWMQDEVETLTETERASLAARPFTT